MAILNRPMRVVCCPRSNKVALMILWAFFDRGYLARRFRCSTFETLEILPGDEVLVLPRLDTVAQYHALSLLFRHETYQVGGAEREVE